MDWKNWDIFVKVHIIKVGTYCESTVPSGIIYPPNEVWKDIQLFIYKVWTLWFKKMRISNKCQSVKCLKIKNYL